MYEKVVKSGKHSYVYYYHNVKIEGKVRNICLGNNLQKAKHTLKKIMGEKEKKSRPISHVVKSYWKPACQ